MPAFLIFLRLRKIIFCVTISHINNLKVLNEEIPYNRRMTPKHTFVKRPKFSTARNSERISDTFCRTQIARSPRLRDSRTHYRGPTNSSNIAMSRDKRTFAHGSLTGDPMAVRPARITWVQNGEWISDTTRDEPRFPTTLHRQRHCNAFAMSRLFFWVLSTVGLWASFWCCRAILLYPENTLLQVSSRFIVNFSNTCILFQKRNLLG